MEDTSGDGLIDEAEFNQQKSAVSTNLVSAVREPTGLEVNEVEVSIVGAGLAFPETDSETDPAAASEYIGLAFVSGAFAGEMSELSFAWDFNPPDETVVVSGTERAVVGSLSADGTVTFMLDAWATATSFLDHGIEHIRSGLNHTLFLIVMTESDGGPAAGSIVAMDPDDDDITEELLADAGKLTGLSLELLGLDPHPDDMTAEQRLQFDPEDLAEMVAAAPADREETLHRTRLLAGLLWNSSSVLLDQLFRDLDALGPLETVTASHIAGSSVLSSLPPQFATRYDAEFARKFIVVAADVTASLVRGWTAPGCLAAELAVRCLLDQAQITQDIYELELPEGWRATVEEVLLEDAASEWLYTDSADGGTGTAQPDVGQWFASFSPGDTVPPYARS